MIERDHLVGRWVHSHEEDTGTEMVLRRSGYVFPPARGRTSFDMRVDGTYVETAPGATDRPEDRAGRWELEEGGRLVLTPAGGPGHDRVLMVTAADHDVLRLRQL